MRTIARLSGVTLSNIYNYFRDKDTLFRAVLQPLLDAFEDLLARHNSDYYLTTDVYSMKSYQEHMLNEFMRLPQHFRAELRLLLFHAAGSSLEHFRDDFCERQTREGIRYIRLMKERYPDRVTGDVSPFFLRTVSSLWLTVMGMRKGAKAIPAVVAAVVMGVAMSPLLNPSREEGALVLAATYAVFTLPICIVCVMLGVNLQAREELLRSASREARLIRTTQEARIAQSRAEERSRISREMHDSLAHRLSLVSLHAGALQTRTDLDIGSVRKIAGSIHTLAADAGRELRQILAVLHDDGSGDGARATWSDVEEVLAHEREAGQEVDLHLAGSWVEAFEAADARSRHAVLRAVEELLTNARRHGAGGAVRLDCEVEAADGPDDDGGDGVAALVVRCVNDCPPTPRPTAPGGGLGLEGLCERLRLLGGELHVSRRTAQFIVMAAVPARPDIQ